MAGEVPADGVRKRRPMKLNQGRVSIPIDIRKAAGFEDDEEVYVIYNPKEPKMVSVHKLVYPNE